MDKAWAAGQKSLWVTKILRTVVVNFHRDFSASTHSDFFQGQMDRCLIYWPDHYEETEISKQEYEACDFTHGFAKTFYPSQSVNKSSKRFIRLVPGSHGKTPHLTEKNKRARVKFCI